MIKGSVFRVWSEQFEHKRKRAVTFLIENPDGSEQLGKLEFVPLAESVFLDPYKDATVSVGASVDGTVFLQTILDHAWSVGMRPVGFLDVKNEMSAVKSHLHDMRALVFSGKVEPVK